MMFSSPWICASCLRHLRTAIPPRQWLMLRRQSTTSQHLSPSLLTRARSLAAEHTTLSEKLGDNYDATSAKRIGELATTTAAIKEYDTAQSALQELRSLLQSSDKEMRELAEDDIEPTNLRLEQASQSLKTSLVPVHPFAHLPCLIEIRPGAGGDEAALFAGDLLKMYTNFCSRMGFKTTMAKLDVADGMTASVGSSTLHVQEAILEIESPGTYEVFRCEAGVHRVQRVPATEKQGRTHTSAVSVLVLPVLAAEDSQGMDYNDPTSDNYVDPRDVRMDVMRASGAGGQHVNKTESAVRLTHLKLGIVVAMQESRSQLANREKAWQILRSRVAQKRREEREAELAKMRRGAGAGKVGRENKVRTYNWQQQRVSDHRSGYDSRNLDDVIEGGLALDAIMDSVRAWMAEQEVLGLLAEEEEVKPKK